MQEQQPQDVPTPPLEGNFAPALSTAFAFTAAAAVLPCARWTSCLAQADRNNSLKTPTSPLEDYLATARKSSSTRSTRLAGVST